MRKNSSQQTNRHVPQRTCVACRKVKTKQELIRLVRVSDTSVEADPDQRKAGRGAYLCRSEACWQIGLDGGRLERTLKTGINRENKEELIKIGKHLFNDTSVE